jgi:hypothetical protein
MTGPLGANPTEKPLEAQVPETRDDLVVSLYKRCVPVAEIAERADVCVRTVRNVARRRGIPARNAPQPHRDAHVVDRYRSGDPVGKIADDHGISRSRVRALAAQAGIPPRCGWARRYPLDEDVFDEPTDVGWWLIGLLAADGSIHARENRVSLCQTLDDADVLKAFYAYVGCPERPLTMLNPSDDARKRQLPRRPAAEARIFSRQIVSALRRHGILPRKTAALKLSREASQQAAVWLGILDGDGSVGIYRSGRASRVAFAGTESLMRQCEYFWRESLSLSGPRPAARPHRRGIWTYILWGSKARDAAQVLLASSPLSMRRKRALLTQLAGSSEERLLSASEKRDKVSPERRQHLWQPQI